MTEPAYAPPAVRDDLLTLCAIGALVAITASLAHEALGHGLACLAEGHRVTLLTFLVFRCDGAGALADGAGPFGMLAVAIVALSLVRRVPARHAAMRIYLLTLGSLGLFWVCAQLVREALDGSDDWGHLAYDLGWPSWWHAAAGLAGVAGYAATIRIAARLGAGIANGRPRRLLLSWLAAAVSATILGALWHGDPLASALDALLSFGAAPLGYLLTIRVIARERNATPAPPLARDWRWIGGASATFLVFAATIARGLGILA